MSSRIGKINNLGKFDSEFFNISAAEANIMDPAARIFLEHTYEAIIDAGVNPRELRGTKTSVLTGICTADTESYMLFRKPEV